MISLFGIGCSECVNERPMENLNGFEEDINIEEIKEAFLKLSSAEVESDENISKKGNLRESTIHWKDAVLYPDQNIIRIPFSSKTSHFTFMDDSSAISYDNASIFIISRKNGLYVFEIMTKIPDLVYLRSTQEIPDFSGKLIFEDINGQFLKGFTVSKGKVDGAIVKLSGRASIKGGLIVNWYAGRDHRDLDSKTVPVQTEYFEMKHSDCPYQIDDFYTSIGEYRPANKWRYVFPEVKRSWKILPPSAY